MEGTGEGSSTPVYITHAILMQLKSQYKKGKLVDEGDFQHNGHSAHGASASGIDSHGVKVAVIVIGIQVQRLNFLTIVASGPEEQGKDLTDQMQHLVKSIRFAGE